jgi:prepilin-type processing-associated H-X9-DG protein
MHGVSQLNGMTAINGISFRGSEIATRHVTDGLSNTYLIGEKSVHTDEYDTFVLGRSGDVHPWITGHDFSVCRWSSALEGGQEPALPGQDRPSEGVNDGLKFGSAHPSGFHMAFCDGSVRHIEYGIDRFVHMAGGNRMDGTVHGIGEGLYIPGRPFRPR